MKKTIHVCTLVNIKTDSAMFAQVVYYDVKWSMVVMMSML